MLVFRRYMNEHNTPVKKIIVSNAGDARRYASSSSSSRGSAPTVLHIGCPQKNFMHGHAASRQKKTPRVPHKNSLLGTLRHGQIFRLRRGGKRNTFLRPRKPAFTAAFFPHITTPPDTDNRSVALLASSAWANTKSNPEPRGYVMPTSLAVLKYMKILNVAPPAYRFRRVGVPGFISYGIRDVGPSVVRKPRHTTYYLAKRPVTAKLVLLEFFMVHLDQPQPESSGYRQYQNFSTISTVKASSEIACEISYPQKNGILHTSQVHQGC